MSIKKHEESSHAELFDLVGELAQRRFRLAERALLALDLNHSEARIVSILGREGTMTQDALSASLTIDRSNAGRSLKKLESSGYIVRHKDESDKRTNVVAITDKGRKLVPRVEEIKEELVNTLFRGLDEKDAKVIVQLLRKAFPDDGSII